MSKENGEDRHKKKKKKIALFHRSNNMTKIPDPRLRPSHKALAMPF